MTFTTTEAEQYVRMTFKQHGVADIGFSWMEKKEFRGLAYFEEKRIELNVSCLESFSRFKETLLHELAHILDYQERGTLLVNSRYIAHGKNWKKWCKHLGIPARLTIP